MNKYLIRYKNGEQNQVCLDLIKLGNLIFEEPYYSDSIEVIVEIMERIKFNIEILVNELTNINYHFGYFEDGETLLGNDIRIIEPPSIDIDLKINSIEEQFGSIPLSLKYFWKIIGGVNLMGYHNNWPADILYDSLNVESLDLILKYELEIIEDDSFTNEESYLIPISPDDYHKARISGGSPYEIRIPNKCFDVILENEKHNTYFIDYLRIALKWGGFTGFEEY